MKEKRIWNLINPLRIKSIHKKINYHQNPELTQKKQRRILKVMIQTRLKIMKMTNIRKPNQRKCT